MRHPTKINLTPLRFQSDGARCALCLLTQLDGLDGEQSRVAGHGRVDWEWHCFHDCAPDSAAGHRTRWYPSCHIICLLDIAIRSSASCLCYEMAGIASVILCWRLTTTAVWVFNLLLSLVVYCSNKSTFYSWNSHHKNLIIPTLYYAY